MGVRMEALENNGTWDVVELREESSRMQVGVHSQVQGGWS